jgi:2-oxoglutarate dehydrogenase E2 component (dihydrolipoamide succinyltransferase)
MAKIEVPMPQMGESIAEGTVSVWLKKVGDAVERDEPIMEISTDKVDAEIPSPAAGTLAEIVVQEGETVEVGTVVAFIETEAGAVAETPAAPASAPAGERETEMPEAAVGQPEPAGAGAPAGSASAAAASSAASPLRSAPPTGNGGPQTREERLRTRSTPLVRRIAAEHGVEVAAVSGTGRDGRVTKEDVLRFVEEGPAVRAPAGAPGTGGFGWEEFYSHVEHPTVEVGPRDRTEAMPRMTSLIAEHMVLSQRISPHVHSYFEVDYSQIDRVRAANRKTWSDAGAKVSYTAFITRACAMALREQPKVNASISGNEIVYRGDVNIGIAVALPWGLIVPVVRNADELSLVGLARRIADLAERARAKKLSPEEVQGGTFTITNPGVFGTVIGFPIINQPQVAILGVGGIEKRPVVISDDFGNDAIVARKRGFLSLGYDHRLVNGADGDKFLARVKEIMEDFPESGA